METYTITNFNYYYTDLRRAINILVHALNKARYFNNGVYGRIQMGRYSFEKNSSRDYRTYDYAFSNGNEDIEVNLDRNALTIFTNLSLEELKDLKNLEVYRDLHQAIKTAAKESHEIFSNKVKMWIQPKISRSAQY